MKTHDRDWGWETNTEPEDCEHARPVFFRAVSGCGWILGCCDCNTWTGSAGDPEAWRFG